MDEADKRPRPVRFGAFEVDLRAGELRKHGLKIKLQEQPFQILTMLLERPGEVVTREELCKKLWPEDTFVDFDNSLNTGINKIREALNDSADNPRFVETLPRRGYRFIYPVAAMSSSPADGGDAAATVGAGLVPVRGRPQGAPLRTQWRLAVVAVLLVAVATTAYWLTRPLPPPRITNAVRIARLHGGTWFAGLFTDGVRLYFTDWLGDRSVIMQVPLTGGDAVPFVTPLRYAAATDISLKRSELLVTGGDSWGLADMPVWVIPLVGGSPRRVGDLVGGGQWSPDGQKILNTKGPDLYLAKDDGTDSRKLASAPGDIYTAAWSPDGTTIRFNSYDPKIGAVVLYEVSADGGNLHRLLPGWSKPPMAECCGIWTPGGGYFVFSAGTNYRGDLWAIREKEGLLRNRARVPVQLTEGPVAYIMPSLSMDGNKLFAIGRLSRGELMKYEAKAQEFVPYLKGLSASDVDFSGDGQWVAYVSYLDGTLWRSRVDGSESLQLTFLPMQAMLPRWSPDGKRIAFMGQAPGKLVKIHLVPAEGGAPRQLIAGEREEADPQWSPDGNQLLFGRWPANPSDPVALHLLDLRTGQVSTMRGSDGLRSPRWSGDGRYVATLKDEDRKLVLFDFSTHRQVELAATKGSLSFPNWSRDGKWVYLWADFTEGRKGIYRVRLTDHKLELVASDEKAGRFWGASGPWVGLTPDDSPLVMRDITLTEIYAFDWEAP